MAQYAVNSVSSLNNNIDYLIQQLWLSETQAAWHQEWSGNQEANREGLIVPLTMGVYLSHCADAQMWRGGRAIIKARDMKPDKNPELRRCI